MSFTNTFIFMHVMQIDNQDREQERGEEWHNKARNISEKKKNDSPIFFVLSWLKTMGFQFKIHSLPINSPSPTWKVTCLHSRSYLSWTDINLAISNAATLSTTSWHPGGSAKPFVFTAHSWLPDSVWLLCNEAKWGRHVRLPTSHIL